MNSILTPGSKIKIFQRIDQLRPSSKPLWGSMTVNQNLRHMAMLFEIAMGTFGATPAFKPPLPKWVLRLILLNVKMPKGKIKTLKEMNTIENNIDPQNFEMERDRLKSLIEAFIVCPKLAPEHSIGGRFSRKDWGRFTYKHTDYHLKQFGV